MRTEKMRALILGGDMRFDTVTERLRASGFLTERIKEGTEDLAAKIRDAELIVLPLPYSTDGIHVFSPGTESPIPLAAVFGALRAGQTLALGCGTEGTERRTGQTGAAYFDYFGDEALTVVNAAATAEGAAAAALGQLRTTLFGARVLIAGYGRIGKNLARIMKGYGAAVTVAARKESDRVWARIAGCGAIGTEELASEVGGQDLILNTIPAPLFDAALLKEIGTETLIIDLASAPGGADRSYAAEHGVRLIWALSLPGKTAPVTAGNAIAEAILRYTDAARSGVGPGTEGDAT